MRELLKMAEANYHVIKLIWSNIDNYCMGQQAMYHVYQAIEKLLECLILLGGTRYAYTYDICKLIEQCPKDIGLPEELEEMAPLLAAWEVTARYGAGAGISIKTLEKCVTLYDKLHTILLSYVEDASSTVFTDEEG